MTIQTINLGNIVNDGLGDDLRTAFQKVNANFATLAAELTVTASNLGSIGQGIFRRKNGVNLEFKSLVAGDKITLTPTPESVVIAGTQPDGFYRITTDAGVVISDDYQFITLQGGEDVTVSVSDSIITVNTDYALGKLFRTYDFGYINLTFDNMIQYNTSMTNSDYGTFAEPSRITVDQGSF